MRRYKIAFSDRENCSDAVSDVIKAINSEETEPTFLIFTSAISDFSFFTEELKKSYPSAEIIGSTSYINFSSEGISHGGLSCMAFYSGIEVSTGVVYDIDRYPIRSLKDVKASLAKLSDVTNTCLLEFCTSYSNGEELVLDTFDIALKGTGINVFGSTAGTRAGETATAISLNGQIYDNCCVYAFIHNLNGRIIFQKENLYKPTSYFFTATSVDCENRIVYEFDEIPAVSYLSEKLCIPKAELIDALHSHPIGRIIDDDIYIIDADSVNEDGSVSFYTRVYNMTKMNILTLDNPENVWQRTSSSIKNELPNASFSICINCRSRSKYFEREKIMDDFLSNINGFADDFFGISGMGEQIGFMHLNQTMVVAVFE